MAMLEEDNQTTIPTLLENPNWGKPSAIEWPVAGEFHRDFTRL